jgi:Tfp pilus assembly protein PilV
MIQCKTPICFNPRSGESGYTILEAMVAVLIISLLAFPLYKLLNTEKKLTTRSRDRASAYFLAAGEMEKLKALSLPTEDMLDKEFQTNVNGKSFTVK